MYDFYLAGPLFCEEDNKGLDLIEAFLDRNNYNYFSPRKDSNMSFTQDQADRDTIAQRIYDANMKAIDNSKIILVNTAGVRHNNAIYGDEGTFIELGYALAKNIPVVTYNWLGYGLNIMISQKTVYHIDNISFDNPSGLEIIDDITTEYANLVYTLDDVFSEEELRKELTSRLRSRFFKKIKEIV